LLKRPLCRGSGDRSFAARRHHRARGKPGIDTCGWQHFDVQPNSNKDKK